MKEAIEKLIALIFAALVLIAAFSSLGVADTKDLGAL